AGRSLGRPGAGRSPGRAACARGDLVGFPPPAGHAREESPGARTRLHSPASTTGADHGPVLPIVASEQGGPGRARRSPECAGRGRAAHPSRETREVRGTARSAVCALRRWPPPNVGAGTAPPRPGRGPARPGRRRLVLL